MALIRLQDVKKTFTTKSYALEALRGVNLQINAGEIYGIIDYSGAGKSTLIRCINLLERPTSGTVIVSGKELTVLAPNELRKSREKIGMIFQSFNLMRSRNVFQNVAYPLKKQGLNRNQIATKVLKLLELVGISEKVEAYPSQLSGGQKQRVAIARALANDPEVLLCDEATSALDPQTTHSILKLLKDINQKLNLTIVVITHEMQVIKEICHRVAVMDHGKIVESGELLQIFANPKVQVTKDFIATVFQSNRANEFLETAHFERSLQHNEVAARVAFIGETTSQTFISEISRRFTVDTRIVFGNIELVQGVSVGNLFVKFRGERDNLAKALQYLTEFAIPVEVLHDVGDLETAHPQCDQSLPRYDQSAV
jgi:D-methionine transport system ATP-binding protein